MNKQTLIVACIFVLGLVLFTASSYEAMPATWHTVLTTGGYLCIFLSFIGVMKERYSKRKKP
jgi:xanthine/uracil permease